MTVIDEMPAGARKLAAVLRRAPGADVSPVEKVQQAADALQGDEKPATPPGVTRVQVEEKGFQASTFVWWTSIGLLSATNQLVKVIYDHVDTLQPVGHFLGD